MVRLLTHASEHDLLDVALGEIAGFVERWPDRRVFLLVPEASKADAERRYLERSGGGLLMAEVLSFKRLAFRLFAEVGGLAVKRLTGTGRAVLIGRILLAEAKRFRRFGNLRQKPGFAVQLAALLDEFSRFRVGPADLQNAAAAAADARAKERFADLATLWEHVEAAQQAGGFVAAAADSQRLIDLLRNNVDARLDFLRETDVYVAGFGELTPFSATETAVLEALSARVKRLTILLPEGEGPSFGHAARSRTLLRRALSPEIQRLDLPIRPATTTRVFSFAENSEDEARLAAGEIRRLLSDTDVRRRDIAVGLCRPEDSPVLADVLRAFEVPSFLDEASDIRWTPFSRYMESLLALSQKRDDLAQVMRLLGNPLSGLDPVEVDRFENACLALGLNRLPAILAQTRLPAEPAGQQAFAACLPFLATCLALGVQLRQARSGRAKVETIVAHLRANPHVFDLVEADIAADRAADYQLQATASARAVNEWQARLEEAAEILHNQVISQAHFCQLLTESIFRLDVKQIPVGLDRVRVAPLRQIVHYPARVLFVLGVSAKHYPLGDAPATFLSAAERQHLAGIVGGGFPDGASDHRLTAAALDRKVRHLPDTALYFSTPDGDNAALPGGLTLDDGWRIRRIRGGTPDLHWNHAAETTRRLERLSPGARAEPSVRRWQQGLEQALGRPYAEPARRDNAAAAAAVLGQETLSLALTRRPVTSVSRIQLYNACPYQFYAAALLGLQERDNGLPDAAVQGEYMHNVLKAALQRLLRSGASIDDWRQALADGLQAELEAAAKATGRARTLGYPGNDMRVTARLSPAIAASLDRIAYLYDTLGVRPVALEYRFGGDGALAFDVDGQAYEFTGVIDRIDRYPDGSDVLVDYKRGDHAFDPLAFAAGLDIQLPFYENAWAAVDAAHTVRGSYYQSLRAFNADQIGFEPHLENPAAHLSEIEKRIDKQSGLAEAAKTIAIETIRRIHTGVIAAVPCQLRSGQLPCRYCGYRVTCRLDQLTGRATRQPDREGEG